MWKTVVGIAATVLCSGSALAEGFSMTSSNTVMANSVTETEKAIEVAEWSLKRSSLAAVLDSRVVDKSAELLEQSRRQLAQGNLRTARELLDSAMKPLAQMRAESADGRHPDPVMHKQTLRETVLSLLPEARRIAAEKRASDAFVDEARGAVERSDVLLADGEVERARRVLAEAYETLQQRLAGLRSGDDFYLAIPQLPASEQWSDGLRRIDERRIISQYLLIEAESSGLDVAQLQSGIRRAEELVADAEMLATQSRWMPALEKLELAYVEYEDSWRTAGVEW